MWDELHSKPFTLQIGAFKEIDKACVLVDRLKEGKFPTFMTTYRDQEFALWYRVRVGTFVHKSEAKITIERLKRHNLSPIFVVLN